MKQHEGDTRLSLEIVGEAAYMMTPKTANNPIFNKFSKFSVLLCPRKLIFKMTNYQIYKVYTKET